MIKVKVDFNPSEYLSIAEKEAKQRMAEVSSEVLSEIKQVTPKDTGAAAAAWKVSMVGTDGEFNLTNEKEYLKYLNQGSSMQAPAMFVESTVLSFGLPRGVVVEYSNKN